MVFLGCIPIKKEEESEKGGEARELKWEDWEKEVLSKRTEIVEKLNKSREVGNVTDLFAKLPGELVFNPVMFNMRIPFSLQKMMYVWNESIRARIEDFQVLYDDSILMVAVVCDLGEFPFGVYDVRDRLMKVLGAVIRTEEPVSPTLYATPITFRMQGESVPEMKEDVFIDVERPTEVQSLLKELYMRTYYQLAMFYDLCIQRHEINEGIKEIENIQQLLLNNLRGFLKTDWKHILRKRSLIKQCKEDMADILEKVSRYLLNQNKLKLGRRQFKTFCLGPEKRNTLIYRLLGIVGFDFYTEPDLFLETESIIKVVDHVRSEIETYSLNISTLISALLGAIAGSAITLALSYLL